MIIKAEDSRQSVDLKWKLRKGLEEGIDVNSEGDLTVGRNLEVDGNLKLNGSLLDEEGNEKFITTDLEPQEILIGPGKDKVIYLNEAHTWSVALHYINKTAYSIDVGNTSYQSDRIYFDNKAMQFRHEGGYIALTSDIKPLYAHTITINTPRSASSASAASVGLICFTAYLTDNQAIDSIQDLCALCGNTDYQVSGYIFHGDIQALVKIHVGTSITDSSVTYIGVSGVVNLKLSEVGVTSVSDSVTAIISPVSSSLSKEYAWDDEEDEEPAKMIEDEPKASKKSKAN